MNILAGISGGTLNSNVTDLGKITSGITHFSFEKTETENYNTQFIDNFHYNSEFISDDIQFYKYFWTGNTWHCELSDNGYNTGKLVYDTLKQINIFTGEETGSYIVNDPNNQYYIYPITNISSCPLPSIYYNDMLISAFTRNNCGSGASGSTINYIVNAGIYSGYTKTEANNKAINDIITNGQTYANTHGTCSVINFGAYSSGYSSAYA